METIKKKNITILKHFENVINVKESIMMGHEKNKIEQGHNEKSKNDEGHKEEGFNIKSLMIIGMGYLMVIIICSIMVFIIENKIKDKSKAYCT